MQRGRFASARRRRASRSVGRILPFSIRKARPGTQLSVKAKAGSRLSIWTGAKRTRSRADMRPAACGRRRGCRAPRWGETRFSIPSNSLASGRTGRGLDRWRDRRDAGMSARLRRRRARPANVARTNFDCKPAESRPSRPGIPAHGDAGEPSPCPSCRKRDASQECQARSAHEPQRRRHTAQPSAGLHDVVFGIQIANSCGESQVPDPSAATRRIYRRLSVRREPARFESRVSRGGVEIPHQSPPLLAPAQHDDRVRRAQLERRRQAADEHDALDRQDLAGLAHAEEVELAGGDALKARRLRSPARWSCRRSGRGCRGRRPPCRTARPTSRRGPRPRCRWTWRRAARGAARRRSTCRAAAHLGARPGRPRRRRSRADRRPSPVRGPRARRRPRRTGSPGRAARPAAHGRAARRRCRSWPGSCRPRCARTRAAAPRRPPWRHRPRRCAPARRKPPRAEGWRERSPIARRRGMPGCPGAIT